MLQVGTLFDDSGIVVRFMNSMTEGNGIRDAGSASALLQQARCLPLMARRLPAYCIMVHSVCKCAGHYVVRHSSSLGCADVRASACLRCRRMVPHAACRSSIVA